MKIDMKIPQYARRLLSQLPSTMIPTLTKAIKDNAGSILKWIVVACVAYAIAFGDGRYVKHEEMAAHAKEIKTYVTPFEVLPAKIDSLEKWQAEQKQAQQADTAQFRALQEQLGALKVQVAESIAIQKEQKEFNRDSFDRILRKLDK